MHIVAVVASYTSGVVCILLLLLLLLLLRHTWEEGGTDTQVRESGRLRKERQKVLRSSAGDSCYRGRSVCMWCGG
jgi:hypothetical protein